MIGLGMGLGTNSGGVGIPMLLPPSNIVGVDTGGGSGIAHFTWDDAVFVPIQYEYQVVRVSDSATVDSGIAFPPGATGQDTQTLPSGGFYFIRMRNTGDGINHSSSAWVNSPQFFMTI